jgi:hypothetical protein
MDHTLTHQEAEVALAEVERGRARVVEEIGLPRWYWWGLALGWIVVGVVADLGVAWATAAATLIFGAVHAAVAPRVASGRHRTQMLSVSRRLAPARTARFVVLTVAALGVFTVAAGFALAADGARDPATIASIFVAILILLGGPQLLAAIRPWESRR